MVAELERLLPIAASRHSWSTKDNSGDAALQSLKAAVQNVNDLLMHAASKIKRLTEQIATAKDEHLGRLQAVRCTPWLPYLAMSSLGCPYFLEDFMFMVSLSY